MHSTAACFLTIAISLAQSDQRRNPDQGLPRLATGSVFQQALDEPFSASWEHVELKTILRRIREARNIAILADRRIDISRELDASATGENVCRFLNKLAPPYSARVCVVGNVIFLGAGDSAEKLRTLVALRQAELLDDSGGVSQRRALELTRPTTVAWHDLDAPAEILARVADHFKLEIANPQEIPHDLWCGAVVPECSAAEILSLLLIQFDRTFQWQDGGAAISIVPVPAQVVIERRHDSPRGQTPDAALAEWRRVIPGLDASVVGGRILVRATVEVHETVERLRRPVAFQKPGETMVTKRPPLSRERFTLRVKDAKVRSLMQRLAQPGNSQMVFVYDPDELRSAKIDLDALVSFELENATAERLLRTMFDPLGVSFELNDRTVRLKARPQ